MRVHKILLVSAGSMQHFCAITYTNFRFMEHLFFTLLMFVTVLGFGQAKDQKILFFAAWGASIKPYSFTGHAFVSWGSLKADDSSYAHR